MDAGPRKRMSRFTKPGGRLARNPAAKQLHAQIRTVLPQPFAGQADIPAVCRNAVPEKENLRLRVFFNDQLRYYLLHAIPS
ncbi:hypothetical protein D3C79_980380 [compost metagenome]